MRWKELAEQTGKNPAGTTQPGTGKASGTAQSGTGKAAGTTQPGTGKASGTTQSGTGKPSGTTQSGTGKASGTTQSGAGKASGAAKPGAGKAAGRRQPAIGKASGKSRTGAGKASGKKTRKPANRKLEMWVAGGIVTALLAAMLVYFVWFEVLGKQDVLVNPLNNRTSNMEKSVRKGDVMTSDNVVIATTQNAPDGTEYRLYPFNGVFAHTLGYVPLGGMGLESSQKIKLLTCNVNFLTQMRNELVGVKNTGDRLITTMDYRLSQYCYDLLGGRNGAIIVMEPKTGKILTMVSSPNFNPNTITSDWNSIIAETNSDANLVNRASQGAYPPGSTFKLITLLEYIREHPSDWQDFRYYCPGVYQKDGYTMSCHGDVHGELDLFGCFALSCNGAFDTIAESLDAERWQKTAEQFGYNTGYSLDVMTRKASFQLLNNDSVPTRMQMAIGQGTTLTTPLLNLMGYCAVANNGVMMKPYLIDRYVTADGRTVESTQPEQLGRACTVQEASLLNTFLTKVITDGTAVHAGISQCQVAGKTGSAQYSSEEGRYHAWFCGYAPAEDPRVAVCVLIERGGTGGEVAAPVAGSIFNYFFSNGY